MAKNNNIDKVISLDFVYTLGKVSQVCFLSLKNILEWDFLKK